MRDAGLGPTYFSFFFFGHKSSLLSVAGSLLTGQATRQKRAHHQEKRDNTLVPLTTYLAAPCVVVHSHWPL